MNKNKVDTLEKLYNYENGKTVDYGDMPDELKDWRNCLYDYEKGVDTYFDCQLEKFSEQLDENEFNLIWDNDKSEYKFDALETMLEKYYPGIVNYLLNNKVTIIRFY